MRPRELRCKRPFQHRVVEDHAESGLEGLDSLVVLAVFPQRSALEVVQRWLQGEARDGLFCIFDHGAPVFHVDANRHQVGPRFHSARRQFHKGHGQSEGFVEALVLVGPVAGHFHHSGFVPMVFHHAVEQGGVWRFE